MDELLAPGPPGDSCSTCCVRLLAPHGVNGDVVPAQHRMMATPSLR
jgi:hypothetical protein